MKNKQGNELRYEFICEIKAVFKWQKIEPLAKLNLSLEISHDFNKREGP